MDRKRHILYRPYTWEKIWPQLKAMPYDNLVSLAKEAEAELSEDKDALINNLLDHGGYLLVRFDLIRDPEAMRGTVFTEDIHEYYLDYDAAIGLSKDYDVSVRYINGDFAAVMTSNEVKEALKSSSIFDQLERA